MTPEQRQRHYQANAARKARRKAELREAEAGRLAYCPVCDRWFRSWGAQAVHETQVHR